MRKLRVGLADDHPFILLGVEHLLLKCPDIEVCFKTESIQQLLDLLDEVPVEVLVCDYEFEGDPYADGLGLLDRIRRVAPATRVVFLSSHSSPYIVSAALNAGAAGFIGKGQEGFVNLPTAVRTARNQSVYVPESLMDKVLQSNALTTETGATPGALSEKEATVVRMICDGMSISAIAARLKRSPKTVSNQKNAGMKKLGAKNDIELVTIMREWHCS
ncbi:response regulator transcription factor [Paraburkholderia sp. MMS20-SJTR3]|uniref:Response regulator transcription factor n=1 Tax=Paraburkholderia sejongensis TaxID=2886946 RepID=A0ABS8K0J4_9BURK|nr:response regulator transcription factor [Paraburkholderia sp. MMS20-SJTR3]MCC8395675.1 response regulator transcription factor [Paraburkholderia sp. MMS20-SJTR3]